MSIAANVVQRRSGNVDMVVLKRRNRTSLRLQTLNLYALGRAQRLLRYVDDAVGLGHRLTGEPRPRRKLVGREQRTFDVRGRR
jgi:hypothetical protein